MSTVKDREQAQRADQERLQKTVEKQARESTQTQSQTAQFGKMVKTGNVQQNLLRAHQQHAESGKQQGSRLQEMARGLKQESVRNQRLHKDGGAVLTRAQEQAKSLTQQLDTKHAESAQTTTTQSTERVESHVVAKELVNEKHTELDKKSETQKDQIAGDLRAERSLKGRANAAIDGDSKRGDGDSKDTESGSLDAARKAGGKGSVEEARETKYTSNVQKIPEEILAKLADAIYVGVNEKGLHTFRMDLKEGVMQGGSVEITAENGKISMTLSGVDGHAKNLMESSKGDLMRRLEKKGLILDELSFR